MRTRPGATIEDLRRAIDCLPRATRVAMLEGIRSNQIIAGAYSTGDGICPMLAAHRAGGRTSLIAFARAWDRFAFRDARRMRARRATARELLVLTSHLEASLLAEDGPVSGLTQAIRQHRELVARRPAERAATERPDQQRRTRQRRAERRQRPGDPDRSRELGGRGGWSWMRIVRRYDEYQRALELLEAEQRQLEPTR